MTWKPGDLTYEISVCQCCMLTEANGECCGPDYDNNHGLEGFGGGVEPLSLISPEDGLAMGGEHSEYCTEDDRGAGCDCDQLGFSWSSCEGCGSPLGGDRYKMTVFPNERLP